MKAKIEIELKPFSLPNFILIEGSERDGDSIPISALDPYQLEMMCKDFRDRLFKHAGVNFPPQQAKLCSVCNNHLS